LIRVKNVAGIQERRDVADQETWVGGQRSSWKTSCGIVDDQYILTSRKGTVLRIGGAARPTGGFLKTGIKRSTQ